MAEKKPKKKKKTTRQGGIKGFFLYHIEKIVLVVAVLLLFWLAQSGMTGYPPLPWQPPELSEAADRADKHIKDSQVALKDVDESLFIIPYDKKAEWIKQEVNPVAYVTDIKWEPTLFPEKIPRGEPKIFAVEKLRAVPGWGAIVVKDDDPRRGNAARTGLGGGMDMGMGMGSDMDSYGGGGLSGYTGSMSGTKLEAKRWIVLTGLIPIQRLLKEYQNCFADTMYTNPMLDMPQFLAYTIERSEYDPTSSNPPVWKLIDSAEEFNKEVTNWAGQGREQVDPSFMAQAAIPYSLPPAYPLPPLARRLFGEEVAYPPYIPLMADSLVETMGKQDELIKQMRDVKPMTLEEMLEQQMKMPFGSAGGTGMGGLGMGGMGGMGGMEDGGMGMGGMGMGGRGMSGMGMGGRGMGGMGTGAQGYLRQAREISYTPPPLVENYLFRYFDFNVDENVSYQYRVKLIMRNPNVKLDPKYLEDEEMSAKPALYSEFSEPTRPTTVGRSSRILAKEIKAAPQNKPWDEPSVTVMPIYFEMEDANEWVGPDKTLNPGDLANFRAASSYNPSSGTGIGASSAGGMGSGAMLLGGLGSRGTTAQKAAAQKAKMESKDIMSDVAFVNITGGKQVDTKDTSPGKALFMGANGTLMLHDLSRDFDETQNYPKPVAPSTTRRPSGGR